MTNSLILDGFDLLYSYCFFFLTKGYDLISKCAACHCPVSMEYFKGSILLTVDYPVFKLVPSYLFAFNVSHSFHLPAFYNY